MSILRSHRPADRWEEGHPLADGRLGVMVLGGPASERFLLNHATGWSGSPGSADAPPLIDGTGAARMLAEARAAVLRGDGRMADRTVRALQHRHSQAFVPLAEVVVGVGGTSGEYRRELDLSTGEQTVTHGGFRRTAYVSWETGVLVLELTAETPLEVDVRLTSGLRVERHDDELVVRFPSDVIPPHDEADEPIRFDGEGLTGAVVARLEHDGTAVGALSARGVRRARLLVAADTSFTGHGRPLGAPGLAAARCRQHLDAARGDADVRRAEHLAAFSTALGACRLETGSESCAETDVRIAAGDVAADPGLVGLLFEFSRYLLVTSSRVLPTTLQGIWNPDPRPIWSSNYTINLNLQLAYWAAETIDVPATVEPLYDFVELLSETGKDTASRFHGARGWAAHHNADLWGYTRPVGNGAHDPRWSYWPLGGVWLLRQHREHDLHHRDDDFLRTRCWAPARAAAEFCLDWLVPLDDGTLGTAPSTSPESTYLDHGVEVATAVSSGVDRWLIADHLRWLVELAARLGVDSDPIVDEARAAAARIPGPLLGRDGIREWRDDLVTADPHHRHLSHLGFAYPGDTPLDDELRHAIAASLDARGDEGPGWSLGWKAALRARLGDGDGVGRLLRLLFRPADDRRGDWSGGLYPNLLVAHPPFQLDGNLAFLAAIAEALLQSHAGPIELLPALPPFLPQGRATGFIARPGVEVGMSWSDGVLESATLRARRAAARGPREVRYREVTRVVEIGPEPLRLRGPDLDPASSLR